MTKPQIIIIRETMLEGIVNDVSMALTVIIIIGTGVYLGSEAMQWFGFILSALLLISKAAGNAKRNTMTIAEARNRLDEIEQDGTAYVRKA